MYECFAQLLAGPGDDVEGWMNILLFIVVGVFWVVGSIIKVSSQKKQTNQKQQPPQHKPARKPIRKTSRTTQARVPSPERPPRPPLAESQKKPHLSRVPELDQVLRSKVDELSKKFESTQTKPPKPKPVEEIIPHDIPDFTSKPLVELDSMRLDRKKRTTDLEEGFPEIDLNYEDPDELAKAILHFEILGLPVSLRDPSHQNTGS